MSPVAVGVVGAGLSARSHALDIITDGDMELAGVVAGAGGSAEDFADTFGCALAPDLPSLLSRVDAVVVAVPPSVVLDVVEAVTDRGTACLVEKPLAVTLAERDRLARLADAGAAVVAPYNRRYATHPRWAAEQLAGGAIGPVTEVEAMWVGPFRDRFAPGAATYRSAAGRGHGVLLDSGSHAIDLLGLLLGDVRFDVEDCELTCNPTGAEIAAGLRMRHRFGAAVRLTIRDADPSPGADTTGAACTPSEHWTCTVRGERGELVVDADGAQLRRPGTPARSVSAGELDRPVTDLHRMLSGGTASPLGTGLPQVVQLSDLLIEVLGDEPSRRWVRPRGKALGRLNGAC